jgi:hypothetical protein
VLLVQNPLQNTVHVFFVLQWFKIIIVGNEESIIMKTDIEQSDRKLDYKAAHSTWQQLCIVVVRKKPHQIHLQKSDTEIKENVTRLWMSLWSILKLLRIEIISKLTWSAVYMKGKAILFWAMVNRRYWISGYGGTKVLLFSSCISLTTDSLVNLNYWSFKLTALL